MCITNQEAIKQFQSLMQNLDQQQKNTFQKPIPPDLYRRVRDSQLVGMSGFSKEGLPVIAVGVGLSTFDEVFDKYYVQSQIQMNEYRDRVILPTTTKNHGRHIDTCVKVLDMTGLKLPALNQLKVVKPLLQEKTRRKVHVLRLWHGGIIEELVATARGLTYSTI